MIDYYDKIYDKVRMQEKLDKAQAMAKIIKKSKDKSLKISANSNEALKAEEDMQEANI